MRPCSHPTTHRRTQIRHRPVLYNSCSSSCCCCHHIVNVNTKKAGFTLQSVNVLLSSDLINLVMKESKQSKLLKTKLQFMTYKFYKNWQMHFSAAFYHLTLKTHDRLQFTWMIHLCTVLIVSIMIRLSCTPACELERCPINPEPSIFLDNRVE